MPKLSLYVLTKGKVLHWMGSIWLLVSLSVSLAAAYGFPRLMVAFAMVGQSRWIYISLWSTVAVWLLFRALTILLLERRLAGLRWIGIVVLGALAVWPGAFVGERLRFYTTKYAYDRVIRDAEAGLCTDRKWSAPVDLLDCEKPVVVTFGWGGFGSSWFGVVYDAADEIAKPAKERSAPWKAREIGNMLSCSGVGTGLGGHYYLAGGWLYDGCG